MWGYYGQVGGNDQFSINVYKNCKISNNSKAPSKIIFD